MQSRRHKRILITGGAGFIGSYLCEHFIAAGDEVICLDNLFTGNRQNVEHLFGNPRFEFVRHDIIFPYLAEVDLVLNFACPASPIHYQNNPIKTLKTNISGTMNMLGLAKRVKATLLQASTSEVYGDPHIHPQSEDYWGNVNPIGIRSCYDEGKRAAETLCFDYHRQHSLDIRVVRIFNTYGPRMAPDDGRVISNFICQALLGEDITIYGDGSQTRSFCYIDDLIRGIVAFCDYPSPYAGPINLGNPNEFTMMELAKLVLEETDSKSKIVRHTLPSDDPRSRKPDLTRAKDKLAWSPEIDLREGLRKTIPYFKTTLGL